ncbi:MAG: universal stress protein [Bacteroidales bacterium]|nr:universal stress protein [Bacteroidales bacterium]
MKLLNKILLAVDFRNSSDNIVDNAIRIGRVFSSEIILIHVLDDDIQDKKIKLLLNEAVIKRLKIIKNKIESEGIKTGEPILEFGSFYEKISKTADNINANIIIIGSAEKLKGDVFKLGITAEKIIRKSDKPVWVIKEDIPLTVKNILCPVDFSRHSKRALKNAITIARRFNAKLIIFNVAKDVSVVPLKLNFNLDKENERVMSTHVKMLDSFLKDFTLTDLNRRKEIRRGDPATEILKAISKYKIDLLIMGSTGKSGLSKMIMGSVTEKVIREVRCSFITLKSENIIDLQLENEIQDIESHFNIAGQLVNDGFFKEAINEYKICLNINHMHIPSLIAISKIYKKSDNPEKAEKYKNMADDVLKITLNRKIEAEIRKSYKF